MRVASNQQGSTNNAIWNYLYQGDPNFCADISNNVDLNIAGQCKYGNGGSGQWHSPCSAADRVYATTITTTPESLTRPPVDMATWYAAAKPGP